MKARDMKQNKPIEKSFMVDGGYIYEMVADPDTETLAYVKYDRLSGQLDICNDVTINENIYIPPQNKLAFSGTMLLPTFPAEYESFASLLENVRSYIDTYLEIPTDYLMIASYYVILSWVYDCFETIPYLRARGEYGTGKSRFLKVIGSLCYRPCFAGGSSTVSPIFRLIDLYGGMTLVLDEADFRFSGPDAEIIKILNTGYAKGTPVLRTEGDRVRVPTAYVTYGPKVIATRKEFEDQALESRCLTNYMMPKTRRDIPLHLPKNFDRITKEIRNQLLMFRLKHYGEYEVNEKDVIEGLEPRINQVLLPLFAIADTDEMRDELREFAKKHAKIQVSSRSESIEALVFSAIIDASKESQYIKIKEVAHKINEGRTKEQGEFAIPPARIGKINKTSFGFITRQVHGVTELVWDEARGMTLCGRYGIEYQIPSLDLNKVEEVEMVEDLFGAKLLGPDTGSPEEG